MFETTETGLFAADAPGSACIAGSDNSKHVFWLIRSVRKASVLTGPMLKLLLMCLLGQVWLLTITGASADVVEFAPGTGGIVTVDARQGINLKAKINGRGPLDLVFDTGASNFMSANLARRLSLNVEGSGSIAGFGGRAEAQTTMVEMLQIGGVTLHHQLFYVLNAPAGDSGEFLFFGYEVLKLLTVKLDYENEKVTFYDARSFHYSGNGAAVEIRPGAFQIFAKGDVDGIPGWFGIDTGDMGSFELFAPFVTQHQLISRYHASIQGYAGQGIGGPDHAFYARVPVLKLGDMLVRRPITMLLRDDKGVGASSESGNIGRSILKKFTITFDCGRGKMYLEKNRFYGSPDVFNRAGLLLDLEAAGLRVKTVIPNSPAQKAGLNEEDLITLINGSKLDEDTWQSFFTRPVGTVLHLTVQQGESIRIVPVALKDIL